MTDPVLTDENRYQRELVESERQWERMQDYANRLERICLSDPPSLLEALKEEGDEALASALILLIRNRNLAAMDCINIAIGDCVRRYADKVTKARFESGEYAEDLPF